ncbi:MAG: hypothetical protein KDH20_21260 [Rhodocyclaceae bacterium]|nr:hypothetical protein [Rhodocyclaceae bacterium]
MTKRLHHLIRLMPLLFALALGAVGSAWGALPWTIIVPAGAGGGTDLSARVFAKYAQKVLQVPVLVQNVPGEGGYRGSRLVADAEAGRRLLLYTHAGIVTNHLTGLAPYAFDRFHVLGQLVSDDSLALMVRGDDPVTGVADLIEAAREAPGELRVATEFGAFTYFLMASLQRQFDLRFALVEVGGDAAKLRALLTGEVRLIPRVVVGIRPYLDEGDVRALGLVADERPAAALDVPTFREQGVPFRFPPFPFMLFAPPSLADDSVGRLRELVRRVTSMPAFRREIEAISMSARYRDPDATAAMLRALAQDFAALLPEGAKR